MNGRRHVVHIINGAHALCKSVQGTPRVWPYGHKWVPLADANKATCEKCKAVAKEKECK